MELALFGRHRAQWRFTSKQPAKVEADVGGAQAEEDF